MKYMYFSTHILSYFTTLGFGPPPVLKGRTVIQFSTDPPLFTAALHYDDYCYSLQHSNDIVVMQTHIKLKIHIFRSNG